MTQLYRFEIKSQNPKWSNYSTTIEIASTVTEAKNKFKATNPSWKIISCVKRGEYYDPRNPSASKKGESSILGMVFDLMFGNKK